MKAGKCSIPPFGSVTVIDCEIVIASLSNGVSGGPVKSSCRVEGSAMAGGKTIMFSMMSTFGLVRAFVAIFWV